MLHFAGLGPAYWSHALIYAVYIKNRLPHTTIKITPSQPFTGKKPNLDRIRVFGCHTSVKKPGKRDAKLDNWSYIGRFLGFTATPKTSTISMITQTRSNQALTLYLMKRIWLYTGSKSSISCTSLTTIGLPPK